MVWSYQRQDRDEAVKEECADRCLHNANQFSKLILRCRPQLENPPLDQFHVSVWSWYESVNSICIAGLSARRVKFKNQTVEEDRKDDAPAMTEGLSLISKTKTNSNAIKPSDLRSSSAARKRKFKAAPKSQNLP